MSIEVNTKIRRPSKEVLEGFRSLLDEEGSITPNISDLLKKMNAMSSDIKPLFEGIRVVGVAVTVKTLTSDIAPVIRSLEVIEAGDIIVVDTHNSKNTAFWGEMLCTEARRRGAVGAILDSAVRDVIELKKAKFPVLCQGITPNAAALVGFGYVNVPIQCGGVVVNPGDIVIADDNGAVVVPRDEAEDILQKTRQFLESEKKIFNRIVAGENLIEVLQLDKLEEGIIDHVVQYGKQTKEERIE